MGYVSYNGIRWSEERFRAVYGSQALSRLKKGDKSTADALTTEKEVAATPEEVREIAKRYMLPKNHTAHTATPPRGKRAGDARRRSSQIVCKWEGGKVESYGSLDEAANAIGMSVQNVSYHIRMGYSVKRGIHTMGYGGEIEGVLPWKGRTFPPKNNMLTAQILAEYIGGEEVLFNGVGELAERYGVTNSVVSQAVRQGWWPSRRIKRFVVNGDYDGAILRRVKASNKATLLRVEYDDGEVAVYDSHKHLAARLGVSPTTVTIIKQAGFSKKHRIKKIGVA